MNDPVPLPDGFMDLFEKKSYAHLATLSSDGTPHVTPVWVDSDGTHVIVNTAKGRVKANNMAERPQVGIEIMDPENNYRYMSVQGRVVEMIDDDRAEDHIHKMAQRYMDKERYPDSMRFPDEVRVKVLIAPTNVIEFDPFNR